MAFYRYNADETSILIDGVNITALAEDFWSFEKEEAYADNAVGAMGDVCRSEINNPLWNATVTVQKTCPQAAFLRSLAQRKEPFSIWCINKGLGVREGGNQAMVNEAPASELGAIAGDAEFSFIVYDGVRETAE